MILSNEQINRYLRHIIMPEIGGAGQKKLLESSVLIHAANINEALMLTYYLAASGIGHIYCCFEDTNGYETLFSNVIDLNSDISINIVDEQTLNDNKSDFRIFIGNLIFIKKNCEFYTSKENENMFIPTIISVIDQWKGILGTFSNFKDLNTFKKSLDSAKIVSSDYDLITLVIAISGTLCCIEGVKFCLNIGEVHNDMLLYDIFSMEFSRIEIYETNYLIRETRSTNNISCNKKIKENLSQSKVLIVGAGGLGCPAALALTMAGVGTIGILDLDKVEISNLNRQILHSVSRIGMPKADSAKIFLKNINPNININTYVVDLNTDNAEEIISNYDIVISAVDNIQTRYLINDSCFFLKKPFIDAGVLRFDGTNTTIIPGKGHCYRCLYPNLDAENIISCSETGVLGPIPGTMGFIQAAEAAKVIIGEGVTLKNKILLFDGLSMEFNVINLERNPDCQICGNNPTITELQK